MTWFLTAVILLCVSIGGAVIQQILATEVQGWILVLSRHLVRRAVLRIPESHRLRYEEEWLAELAATRSRPVSALIYSVWVLVHARRTGREIRIGGSERPDRTASVPESTSRITVGTCGKHLMLSVLLRRAWGSARHTSDFPTAAY